MIETIPLQVDGVIHEITVARREDGYAVTIDGRSYRVGVTCGPGGRLDLALGSSGSGHKRARVHLVRDGRRQYAAMDGVTWRIEAPDPRQSRAREAVAGSGALVASMPGLVLDVLAEPGAAVNAGATLVLLEAMKMELRITAPVDGRVAAVYCAAGDVVERGRQLILLEADE